MSENTKLWDAVRTVDPEYTKPFKKVGGFSGTSPNAVYLIRLATQIWGPMGGSWGVRIVGEELLQGAPIMDGDKNIANETIHKVQIELWHPGGTVPAFGMTTFVGKNKFGFFTDEEAPKKSLTDALTKALSWLGFAADIHMGMYDDNKYVNDVRQRFEEEKHQSEAAEVGKKYQEYLRVIREEENNEVAGQAYQEALHWCSQVKNPQFAAGIKAEGQARKERLNQQQKAAA